MPSLKPLKKVFVDGSGLGKADTTGLLRFSTNPAKWFVQPTIGDAQADTLRLLLHVAYLPAFDAEEAHKHAEECPYFSFEPGSLDSLGTTSDLYEYTKGMSAYFVRGREITGQAERDTERMNAVGSIALSSLINRYAQDKLKRLPKQATHRMQFGDSDW